MRSLGYYTASRGLSELAYQVAALFVNASNELGQFESGVTAALFGPVIAAALGGVGTVVVALLWTRLFPVLRDLQRLES
ncbi:MAG: hypothetical protein JO042_00440 [Sinobacteraceae bacterium]|nr:hypothetical protein [Nevskiaceae bacterium]